MVRLRLFLAVAALAIGLAATPLAANPRVDVVSDWAISPNMTALGFAANPVPLDNTVPGSGVFNSDLAFQGDTVVQGTYDGFVFYDVTYPSRPKIILNYEDCAPGNTTAGNQGDVIVYGDILIRSWNSGAPPAGSSCDGEAVPAGWEGLHVFDISNKLNPDLVASVETPSGSHTATLVPDLANNRLLVYNNSAPTGFDMIQVPLANPAGASYVGEFATGRGCHDWAVMLADVMRAACSGGDGFSMFSIGGPSGGSLDNPKLLYSRPVPGIGGHSAAFTFDGKVYVHGWEPGGGSGARCTATGTQVTPTTVQTDDMKSYFFFNVETGEQLGKFVMPRDQTLLENCTIHNYNIVPLKNKNGKPRYVLVSGNYQAGISVVDFSDPANAEEIAYADPPPLVDPNPPVGIELGGDWSTYWYNGRIYESDITRGLIIWRLDDDRVATYLRTPYLNPQTTEFSIRQ